MKKLWILVGLAAALLPTACKKDKATPGTGTGNNHLLKKVTRTIDGTTTVFLLSYDAQKRLVSFKSTDNSEYTHFTYDNAGHLIKAEAIEPHLKSIYTFAYSNGLPASGTVKVWETTAGEPDYFSEDNVLTYTVANNQVTHIHQEMKLSSENLDVTLSYQNNDLRKIEAESVDGPYSTTLSFGTHPPVFPAISPYMLDLSGLSLQFAVRHELLSATFHFPDVDDDSILTTQYTYDADGYVLTADDGETLLTLEYE